MKILSFALEVAYFMILKTQSFYVSLMIQLICNKAIISIESL